MQLCNAIKLMPDHPNACRYLQKAYELEALTFRLRGLEESSFVITKAETQQLIGNIGSGVAVDVDLEALDFKDKECIECIARDKGEKLKPYER